MVKTPLIIFGFDAGSPELMLRWAREGHMPALASLLERGCHALTAGAEMLCEHGVWLSLMSGVSRSRYGYYYFRQLRPGTYDLRPVTGLDLDARPFWAHLRGRGRRVAVVDVPDCYPVRGLEGLQLTNWANHLGWKTRDPAYAPHAEPPTLLEEARRIAGPRAEIVEKADAGLAEDRRTRRRMLEQIARKGELCRTLLKNDGGAHDLVVTVFSESHAASHQFWKYRDGEAAKNGAGEMTNAVRDVYAAIDRELGLLLEQIPKGANVFVLSSVGVREDYPTTELIESFCRSLGYQASPEGAPLSLNPLALARRTLPESWRVSLSRRLPRDTRERLLADRFRAATDWGRTRAFALPSFYTSFLRVNLMGREPQGTVEPGAEYDALLSQLESDLNQLRDADTGERAVLTVTRAREAFGLAGPPVELPDLFVEWKHDRFMPRVAHPRAALAQSRPEFFRASDHSRQGFVAAAGPSVRARGALGELSLLDLAPTFLSLLGETPPPQMTGRAIADFGLRNAD